MAQAQQQPTPMPQQLAQQTQPGVTVRLVSELSVVLPNLQPGKMFQLRIPGVSELLTVPFPSGAQPGQQHTFRLEKPVRQLISKAPAPAPAPAPRPKKSAKRPRGYTKIKLADLQAELHRRGSTNLPKTKAKLVQCVKRLDEALSTGGADGEARELKIINRENAQAAAEEAKLLADKAKKTSAPKITKPPTLGQQPDTNDKTRRVPKKKRPLEPPGEYTACTLFGCDLQAKTFTTTMVLRVGWRSSACPQQIRQICGHSEEFAVIHIQYSYGK